jgi:hypothetical protein
MIDSSKNLEDRTSLRTIDFIPVLNFKTWNNHTPTLPFENVDDHTLKKYCLFPSEVCFHKIATTNSRRQESCSYIYNAYAME